MNEQHFWTVFFANVAIWAFLTVDPLCEELDDPTNCAAWHAAIDAHRERIKPVAVHTSEHPYCLMSDCPCHDDAQDDLLHTDEHPYCDDPACWCHLCEQEIPITLAEMEAIMSEPSPLEVDIEEDYHRPLRISPQFQGMMDSLLLEHD